MTGMRRGQGLPDDIAEVGGDRLVKGLGTLVRDSGWEELFQEIGAMMESTAFWRT